MPSSTATPYFDYAAVPLDKVPALFEVNWKGPVLVPATSSNSNFPVKVHYMLSDMERDGLQSICAWQDHGRAFFIHDTEAFEKEHLPL